MASVRGNSSSKSKKRSMSPQGAGFFRGMYDTGMKMPEPVITTIAYVEQAPEVQTLADEMEQHLWPLSRFSSTAHDGKWAPCEGPMDRGYHVTERILESEAAIDSYAQSVMFQPLSHDHPLWTATVLKAKKGRSAMLFRIHHSIGDGIGLLFAFLPILKSESSNILDEIPLPSRLKGKSDKKEIGSRRDTNGGVFKKLCRLLPDLFRSTIMFFKGFLSVLVVKQDSELMMNAPVKQRSPFLPFSGRHVFTRMPPVPLSALQAVGKQHGCSVNDAIMAALCGAFRRYGIEQLQDPLLKRGEPVECKTFMLLALPRPVDLENPSASLVNRILTPVFHLPIDEPLASKRLQRTVKMSSGLKSLPYIAGIRLTTNFVTSVAPLKALRKVASEAISKVSCNTSSVPLPKVPISIAGKELKEVQVLFVNNIPQVSLITYRGTLFWNVTSDPNLMPDAAKIGQHFMLELEELAQT